MARIRGTRDDDNLSGGDGADVILGLAGYDYLHGNGGDDRLDGGTEDDELFGGDGRDVLIGGDGGDRLDGDNGVDTLMGGVGEDLLWGGGGADLLQGGDDYDVLRGEDGDDVLEGGAGRDWLSGGAGVDGHDGGDDFDFASFYALGLTMNGAVADLRTGEVADDGFGNRETLIGIEGLSGTVFADSFRGDGLANEFYVDAGDTVLGFGGDDRFFVNSVENSALDGGGGADALSFLGERFIPSPGGAPTRVEAENGIVVDLRTQRVIDDGFGVSGDVSGFEQVLGGELDDRLTGDGRDNLLWGGYGFGFDTLIGGAGDDVLGGGYGDDVMKGGAGVDTFAFGLFHEYIFGGERYSVDRILDFGEGDLIQIIPDWRLRFIGTDEFSDENSSEVRYDIVGGDTIVRAQWLTPVGGGELTIRLNGVHELTEEDFRLLEPPALEPTIGVLDAMRTHFGSEAGTTEFML